VIAGEFRKTEKVIRAILLNVPIFLLYFLSFVALLLILFFIDERDDDKSNNILNKQGVMAVCIALILGTGYCLLLCFLGYGLVKIPIETWIQSN